MLFEAKCQHRFQAMAQPRDRKGRFASSGAGGSRASTSSGKTSGRSQRKKQALAKAKAFNKRMNALADRLSRI